MKVVEFYRTTKDGQESIGQVFLDDKNKVHFVGLSDDLIETLKAGVLDPKTMKLVKLKDGVKFLETLQFEFSGSYLRASEVKQSKK